MRPGPFWDLTLTLTWYHTTELHQQKRRAADFGGGDTPREECLTDMQWRERHAMTEGHQAQRRRRSAEGAMAEGHMLPQALIKIPH